MTVFAPFAASDVKVDRAEKHLAELKAEVDAYFASGAVRIMLEAAQEFDDVEKGMRALVYRQAEPIPAMWSAIVGDVLHNVRAAYDLLACDVHRITGGKPEHTEHVHYPFCKKQEDLGKSIKNQRLHHIPKEFRDLIVNMAPYHGGNNGLRAIHDLDILDKHQALLPVVSIAKLSWPVPIKEGSQTFTTRLDKDGQRIIMGPDYIMSSPIGTKVDVEFQVLFESEGAFAGQPLVGQLDHCIGYTRHIIGEFRAVATQLGLTANGTP